MADKNDALENLKSMGDNDKSSGRSTRGNDVDKSGGKDDKSSSKPSDKSQDKPDAKNDNKLDSKSDGGKDSKKDGADAKGNKDDKGSQGGKDGKKDSMKDKLGDAKGKVDDAKSKIGEMVDEKGVHGDKGLQKQIEHGAADKALYAVPGVNKVQAARDGLKKFNEGMKDAGLSDGDGALDKVADATDKVVDKGLELGKKGAAAGAAGGAVGAMSGPMLLMMMLSKAIAAVKGFFAALIGMIAKAASAVWGAVAGFFTGLAGGAAAVGNAIAAAVFFVPTLLIGAIVGVVVTDDIKQDDGYLLCVPERTAVNINVDDYVIDGLENEIALDHAQRLYSVMKELGGSDYAVAGLIGNMWHESGLDPTGIETVTPAEPYQIGPKKQHLIDVDFDPAQSGATVGGTPYHIKYPRINKLGRGLSQWTDTNEANGVAPGGTRLLEYAEANDQDWFTMDLQIQYIIDEEDGDPRSGKLKKIMEESPFSDLTDATTQIAGTGDYGYIHNAALLNLEDRLDKAEMAYLEMEMNNIVMDSDYAKGILDKANQASAGANNIRNAYYQDDGCGQQIRDHYNNKAADGTGQVPSDVTTGAYYTPDTLPDSLKEFYADPQHLGIEWRSSGGWLNVSTTADQCTDLAQTYFMHLYNKDTPNDRPQPGGHGAQVAGNWANHLGQQTSPVPSEGAVFSDSSTSSYGHTGIVQHVFANGDILIIEQNSPASGLGAGMTYSWNWRVVVKSEYEGKEYTFFRPEGKTPQWHSDIKD